MGYYYLALFVASMFVPPALNSLGYRHMGQVENTWEITEDKISNFSDGHCIEEAVCLISEGHEDVGRYSDWISTLVPLIGVDSLISPENYELLQNVLNGSKNSLGKCESSCLLEKLSVSVQ